MKRDELWKERKISQPDKAFNVSTFVLFISKYSTCIQRWAGKLLPCSAREWRVQAQGLQALSEARPRSAECGDPALLTPVVKITPKKPGPKQDQHIT